MTNQKFVKSIVFFVFFLLFSISGIVFLDPDLGWQIRSGGFILKYGIPLTDPFSYTMSSFPWINHEWSVSLLFYWANTTFGVFVLSILLALVFLLVYFCFYSSKKNLWRDLIPLLLGLMNLSIFWGIRAQVFSWIFYLLIFSLMLDLRKWRKWRIFIPIIFLLWANINGAFVLGFLTIILYVVYLGFKEQSDFFDIVLLGSSAFATILNPYGLRLYTEIFRTVFDNHLDIRIEEWISILLSINFVFLFLLALSLILLWKYRPKYNLFEIVLYTILLLASINSRKYAPYWVIVSIPLTIKGFEALNSQIQASQYGKALLFKLYSYAVIFICFLFVLESSFMILEYKVSSEFQYPNQAIQYLKAHPFQGQLFSTYNWGGYLDWQYPEKKVFIDGRMPSWSWRAPEGQLNSAIKVFNQITDLNINPEPIFLTYKICRVLYPNSGSSDINLLTSKFFKSTPKKSRNNNKFISYLINNGWNLLYKDKVAVVYGKNCS